jgi:hypothetical protein
MKNDYHARTDQMERVFGLGIQEIENVLTGKKTITDVTRLASNTLSNYSRILSSEIHERALEFMAEGQFKKLPHKK